MSIVNVPDVGEVRKQLKHAIDAHKRANASRRAESDQATKQFETWIQLVGEPLCREFTSALRGEGYQFRLQTPQGVARVSSERSPDDFLELATVDAVGVVAARMIAEFFGEPHNRDMGDNLAR